MAFVYGITATTLGRALLQALHQRSRIGIGVQERGVLRADETLLLAVLHESDQAIIETVDIE